MAIQKRNKTRYALLGILSDHPMSGYDIKQYIEKSISHFWSESYGQIYPILRQLVEENLVVSENEKTSGGRSRILYTITPKGMEELKGWLAQPAVPSPLREETLLKLFFGQHMPTHINLKHIQEYRRQHEAYLQMFDKINKAMLERYKEHPAFNYWQITLLAGIENVKGVLNWCEQAEKILETTQKD